MASPGFRRVQNLMILFCIEKQASWANIVRLECIEYNLCNRRQSFPDKGKIYMNSTSALIHYSYSTYLESDRHHHHHPLVIMSVVVFYTF